MASFSEVNSFVVKFMNLWHTGRDACLRLETQAGEACVTLRLGLGKHPHQQQLNKKVSPSRERRRDRRAAARLVSAENVEPNANLEKAEEAFDEEHATENDASAKEAVGEKTATPIVDEISTVKANYEVLDEICDDDAYGNKQEAESDATKKIVNSSELVEATVKEGIVQAQIGEIIIEVRPQYGDFSAKELATKLTTHVRLKLVCLPWVANTGKHFFTAGFKVTEDSYENFKSRETGLLPKGFQKVNTSWKLN